jgi:hypothetical protein
MDSSTTLIFIVSHGSCMDYAHVLKSRSYNIWFKSEILAASQISEIITPEPVVV